jgi:rRNA-processing protein FCF1|tara:strand:+ start:1511 stop:1882 length:372 start_codon:yes stop_codon:yes gene_type:complete
MRKALLDSSFLISAAKEKLDLFEELQEYEILIPEQVITETFRIAESNQSQKNKDAASLALKILHESKDNFKRIDLDDGHTDSQIVKYAEENPDILVATLDKEIKGKLKGRSLVIRQGSKVEVV